MIVPASAFFRYQFSSCSPGSSVNVFASIALTRWPLSSVSVSVLPALPTERDWPDRIIRKVP